VFNDDDLEKKSPNFWIVIKPWRYPVLIKSFLDPGLRRDDGERTCCDTIGIQCPRVDFMG